MDDRAVGGDAVGASVDNAGSVVVGKGNTQTIHDEQQTGSLTALFTWYMVEITIASTGINTREYRVLGTPMVVGITVALAKLAHSRGAH